MFTDFTLNNSIKGNLDLTSPALKALRSVTNRALSHLPIPEMKDETPLKSGLEGGRGHSGP